MSTILSKILLSVVKLELLKKLFQVLSNFCISTSIHGLWFIHHGVMRIPWVLLTLFITSICLWACTLNVQTYLQFDVQTKVTLENFSTADFPAITFWPQYPMKRSGMSTIPGIENLLAIAASSDKTIALLTRENKISCGPDEKTPTQDPSTIDNKMKLLQEEMSNGTYLFDTSYFVHFENILQECYWENTLFECSNAFMNRPDDIGVSFTFNAGHKFAVDLQEINAETGLTLSQYTEELFQINSPNVGLRLIMKINQSDQCGNIEMKEGSGMLFHVHNKETIPSRFASKYSYLSPGFHTSVSLQKIKYNRKTENLGRCSHHVELYIALNADQYYQDKCYYQCYGELVVKNCHCFPAQMISFREKFNRKFKQFGINNNDLLLCQPSDNKCLKKLFDPRFTDVLSNCNCPVPCIEDGYIFRLSHTVLSKRLFGKKYENLTDVDFKHNFLAVSFEFATMMNEVVEETQAFTIIDTFIYMGSNIGLFLGMSFMSLGEIFVLKVQLLEVLIRNICNRIANRFCIRKTKVKKIRINRRKVKTNKKKKNIRHLFVKKLRKFLRL